MTSVSEGSLMNNANELWDRVDFLIYRFEACSSRFISEELHLKSQDMSARLSTFKGRLEETIDHVLSCQTQDDELWDTFIKDMNDVCSLLKASIRSTFVEAVSCVDIDRMAMNLFLTTKDILEDWTSDFCRSDFEVDREDVWLSYKKLLGALCVFYESVSCEDALSLQYTLHILPVNRKKCSGSIRKKKAKGVSKGVSKRVVKQLK